LSRSSRVSASPRVPRARPGSARLTRSREDYLKVLFELDAGTRSVAVGVLARRLSVSPPSATNMLARLAREGLLTRAARGEASLTPSGRRLAVETVRRHRLLETFLVRVLGLDWSDVHEDAEVLEHAVSDRVLAAMAAAMDYPGEDPHGHPIPDRSGRLPRRALVPLVALGAGERAVVRELEDREPRRMARWKREGLVPGSSVRLLHADADGVFAFEVGGRRCVAGREAIDGVLVERRRTGARP
jgi:DtxR family transcriptional regulator, Mn-dependent transcriptional regulator